MVRCDFELVCIYGMVLEYDVVAEECEAHPHSQFRERWLDSMELPHDNKIYSMLTLTSTDLYEKEDQNSAYHTAPDKLYYVGINIDGKTAQYLVDIEPELTRQLQDFCATYNFKFKPPVVLNHMNIVDMYYD